MKDLQVLIVARPGDEHGDRIEHAIRLQTNSVARLSLNTLRSLEFTWIPGNPLNVGTETDQYSFSIGPTSTIWWRRPGWVEIDDLAKDEGELIDAEIRSMFEGMLIAAKPRWVDHPGVVHLAENKLYQLSTAREAALPIPNSEITSSANSARTFASGRRVIVKTISTGEGLAPFADEVPTELLERVVHAPVLLQERVDALADLRPPIADAEGRIRHHQFGEGGYEECERVIQQLLREAGGDGIGDDLVSVSPDGFEAQADWTNLETPETYLGYQQCHNFASPDGVTVDEPHRTRG